MELPERYVVFDMDGTLSDCTHRLPYAQSKQWSEFHARCIDDPVNVNIADLMARMTNYAQVLIVTGRNESFRLLTMEWLRTSSLIHYVDSVLMRPDDDFCPDPELKIKLLERHIGSKEDVIKKVWFVVDDRDSVVEGLRNYGLTVLQCSTGGY